MSEPREPDYEAIIEDRAAERYERYLDRMDARYGRIEDWRPQPTARTTGICMHCQEEIQQSFDPNCPWVHLHSGNSFCDVMRPADAVTLAGNPGRTEAAPADTTEGERA